MFKKLKKLILGGTIFSTAANMHACVYGPPESLGLNQSSDIKTYDDSQNERQTTVTTTNTEFRPEDNENEDVYGPPEYFGAEPEEPDDPEEESSAPEDSFDPEENLNVCVYGPPEMFGGEMIKNNMGIDLPSPFSQTDDENK